MTEDLVGLLLLPVFILPFSNPLPSYFEFKLKTSTVQSALDKGVHFELQYSGGLIGK